MSTHALDASRCHTLFDASLPPALTIDSGDVVTFKTLDACWGEVRSIDDFHRYRSQNRRSNPITGPVFVRNAVPGGTLRVDVLRIELDPIGFQLIGPSRGLIRDEVPTWTCHLVRVEGATLTLSNGTTLPTDPVIGQLGNAPAGEPTNKPTRVGGNLDCPFIRQGATVYLPVEVEGAMFSVGDVHARQGDGEIVGAPEIGATVTLRLSVLPQKLSSWPIVEDAEHWHALASAQTDAEAIRLAVFNAADFLCSTAGMSLGDAMVLMTMIAEIHCCRTGAWADHGPVVAVSMSKRLMSGSRS
jgi:amidase